MAGVRVQDCKHDAARPHGIVPGVKYCPMCGACRATHGGEWQIPITAVASEQVIDMGGNVPTASRILLEETIKRR